MPATYAPARINLSRAMDRFSHELHQGILQLRVNGRYPLTALQDALDAAIANLPAGERPNLLLDLRRSDSLADRPAEEVAAFGLFLRSLDGHLGPRCALVVADDQQDRRLHAARPYMPVDTGHLPHSFRDMLQAITWLTDFSNRSAAQAAHPLESLNPA